MVIRNRYLALVVVMVTAACVAPASTSPQPSGAQPSTPGQPASPDRSSPTPSTSAPANVGVDVPSGAIVQVLADDVRMRDEPGLDATAIAPLSAGQRARVVGGPQDADGYRWYQVSLLPSDVSGWVAAGDTSTPWIALVANGNVTSAFAREVWTVDEDGDRESFAQLDEGWNAAGPSWAPDGRALAISENRQDADLGCVLEGRVAVLDATGRRIAQSSPPPGTYDANPAWSPDGSQVAFTRLKQTCASQNQQGFPDLYVMPMTGGTQRLVVSNATGAIWSPTGDTFAYLRFDPAPTAFAGDLRGPEIWMITADGSGEHRVGGRVDDGQRERLSDHIAWAPDGSVLAFSRAVGEDLNSTEIDLIDLRGQVRSLARVTGGVRDLTWLPDGGGIAFIEDRQGATAIVVLSPSGEEAHRFELTDGVPRELVVAPDGSAFAWGMGTSDLRVQPLADGEARTYQDTPNAYLSWQPILLD